jgi:malonate transporter and related proteins
MAAVFTALATMAAIIGAGWFLGHRGTLGAAGLPVLARVCFAVATPCLLFVTVAQANLHLLVSRSALIAGVSATVVALCAIVMLALVWRRAAADVVVGTLAASYVNAGNLGLPLAVYLLGDAVAVVPPLLFQLLVIAPIAFSVLDARLTTTRSGVRGIVTRTFGNPIIVASLSGLLLAGLPWKLPVVMLGPFALIGAAAAPLALLTFGMSIAVPPAQGEATRPRELVLVAVLRSVVSPTVALLLGHVLGLEGTALLAVVAMAALPTAQNVLVYATHYGRGQALARDAGVLTTTLAVPALLIIAAMLG